MKALLRWIILGAIVCLVPRIQAAQHPHIQYSFPAGGQQGTTFQVELGGQFLQGTTNVFVTGEGVSAKIVKYTVCYEPRRLRQMIRNRANKLAMIDGKTGKERARLQKQIDLVERQVALADLPEDVDPYNKKELARFLKVDVKEQFNPQIADRLLLEVTIDQDAPTIDRELRVYTPKGLSNPLCFQVSNLTEVQEKEPNDDHMKPELQEVPVPSVINGQVRPGDIDHFRFKVNKGDSIVVDVGARRIIPYLADAVPGWFQAVIALYDEDGNEVAYQDDYKFNPDPVLFFDAPNRGTYTLSIRDSIYRGREDFIYRIAIGELPFITSIFPLGAQQGKNVDIALSGRNLPKARLTGKLPNESTEVRHVSVMKNAYRSNQMPFAIGEMQEVFEVEPNDVPDEAQGVARPLIVNGRIQQKGDRDLFKFKGVKGESVSIEVIARRLNSPLDSVITLTGPGLKGPVRNDDYSNKDKTHLYLGAGLVTHHADSFLFHELPATGTYFLEIGDAQFKGGHEYGYRLRISTSAPSFKLSMEPSGLQIGPNGTAAFTVRATRVDGFDDKIMLKSTNLPDGFVMSKAEIPKGSDSARFTITAPKEIEAKLVTPAISGVGIIDGKPVTHPAVPVDDQMQAFLYRHLVPAQELVLAPVTKKPPLAFEARIPKSGVIEVPLGEEMKIQFVGRIFDGAGKGAPLKLDNPPDGITLSKGWISRKKFKRKDARQNSNKNMAVGHVIITAEEPLIIGQRLSLVVVAEAGKRKEKIDYPAPAIPIKIVKPRN